MESFKLKTLLFQLKRLRDPRNSDAHGDAQYCLGAISWARLGDEINKDEHERLFQLILNARKHSCANTPWPEAGEWFPF
jgi:hypothetical protein